MNILIIEDEKKAARELAEIITSLSGSHRIIDVIESVEDGIEWFLSNPLPDLIFSDIQLADGLSFEIFRKLKQTPPVIFCTAFDEYALEAFETNGIQYILKPVNKLKVQHSLERYIALRDSFLKETFPANLRNLIDAVKPSYRRTILVNFKEKIIPVGTDDIAFLYSGNGVITLGTNNAHSYFIHETLDDFEKTLDPSQFFRANRQFIIRRDAIKDIERYFSRKLILKLKVNTPEEIVVSKMRSGALLEWLEVK